MSSTGSMWSAGSTAGLTLVRRNAQRREPRGQVRPAFDPDLFRARFALLRRIEGEPDARLVDLFDRHPRIGVAWQALQELYGLYDADDRDGALAALDRFTDLYATGEIPEFGEVVDTFLAWSTEILASTTPPPVGPRTVDSRAPTTSSKSSDGLLTGSSTEPTTKPEASSPADPYDHPNRHQQPPPHEHAQSPACSPPPPPPAAADNTIIDTGSASTPVHGFLTVASGAAVRTPGPAR